MDAEHAPAGSGKLDPRQDSHGAEEGTSKSSEAEGAAAESSDRNEAAAGAEGRGGDDAGGRTFEGDEKIPRAAAAANDDVALKEPPAGFDKTDQVVMRSSPVLSSSLKQKWESNFRALEHFFQVHGHLRVSCVVDPLLYDWMRNQRATNKRHLLHNGGESYTAGGVRRWKERKLRLDELSFDWEGNNQAWEAQYGALEKFNEKHGHLQVSFVTHPSLYAWMRHQRKKKKRYLLHNSGVGDAQWEERKRRLDELNFDWELKGTTERIMPNDVVKGTEKLGSDDPSWLDTIDGRWVQKFQQLVEYSRSTGHCDVPLRYAANRRLGIWVAKQRSLYRSKALGRERISHLESLGFRWRIRKLPGRGDALSPVPEDAGVAPANGDETTGCTSQDTTAVRPHHNRMWMQQFEQLVEYSRSTGHCDVPIRYAANRRLGRWVNGQRSLYWSKALGRRRIEQLESLGFRWRLKAVRRRESPGHGGDDLSSVAGDAGVHGSVKSTSEELKESGVAHNSPPLGGATATPGNGSSGGAVGPQNSSQAEGTTGRASDGVGQTKVQQVEAAPSHLHHLERQAAVAAVDRGASYPLATVPLQQSCEHEDCLKFADCAKRRRASSGGGYVYVHLCRAHFDLATERDEGTKGVADGDRNPDIGKDKVQEAKYWEGAAANKVKLSEDVTEPRASRKRKAREDKTPSERVAENREKNRLWRQKERAAAAAPAIKAAAEGTTNVLLSTGQPKDPRSLLYKLEKEPRRNRSKTGV